MSLKLFDRRKCSAGLLACLLWASAQARTPQPPAGTPVTFQDGLNGYSGEMDTYLDRYDNSDGTGAGNTVEGHQQWLEVRWFPGDGSQEDMLTLIQFDLSSIPTNATITSAQLQLYNLRAAANNANSVVTLSQVTSAWNTQWTWNMGVPTTVPTSITCPSTVGYSIAPATPESYLITGMESLVQGWVTTPASNLGLMLSTSTELNIRFASSRYATAQYRPALQVTYTTGGTPPTVSVDSPPASTSSSPVGLNGTATPAGAATITQVTWTNATTGASGTASGTTSWSASIPLLPGPNSITITATDSTGAVGTATLTIKMTGSLTGSPSSHAKGEMNVCGGGAAGEAPVSFALTALAAAALLIGCSRRGDS